MGDGLTLRERERDGRERSEWNRSRRSLLIPWREGAGGNEEATGAVL